MRTIDKRLNAKLAPVLIKRAATLTLTYDARCKSRFAATLDSGEEVGVVLPRGTVLRDGDMLVADAPLNNDGGLVRVIAAPQSVLLVRAPDRLTLTRAAYHLGNRHTPVEVAVDELKLEADPVLEDMLKRLGAQVERAELPFQPEAGAYSGHSGGSHRHGHDETFAEDYALAQRVFDEHHAHDHSHGHGEAHDHSHDDHVHGAACGHDHGHDHGHCDGHAHDHSHEHR